MSLAVDGLRRLLAAHPGVRRLLVAYSGGVDSHALLHWLAGQRGEWGGRTLAAVHVNHGLQPAAGEWERHCRRVCHELGVAFHPLRVDARPAAGESPEAAARAARYAALQGLLTASDALLTAQHQDDQAETLLLQLLRGAGPPGLAAMPLAAPFGAGWLWRPLLANSRAGILAYAETHSLVWVEDASNTDQRLDRNYLRHQIMPALRARWPAVSRTCSRSARWCAEAAALAEEVADADLAKIAGPGPDRLSLGGLRKLTEVRQRNALRRWFRRLALPVPTASQLTRLCGDVVTAPRDRMPLVRWPGGEVRRYRELLFAMAPLAGHDPEQVLAFTGPALDIPALGRLWLQPVPGQGLSAPALAGAPLTVRFRRGGERSRPAGRQHRQALKKLLQEAGVPPWERERLPLLYAGEALAAVADLWVEADFAAGPGEAGFVLAWQKPLPSDNV